jgi:hypothetical protein
MNVRIDHSGKKSPRPERNSPGSLGHLDLRRGPGGRDAFPFHHDDCVLHRGTAPSVNHAFGFYRNYFIHMPVP